MKLRLLALSVIVAIGAVVAPQPARADIDVYVDLAPPATRYERVPGPRAGYVWVAGHWDWRHNRHAWVPGRWVVARPGYVWSQPRWERDGRRWHYVDGRWANDRHYRGRDRDRHRDRHDRYDRYDDDRNYRGRDRHRDWDDDDRRRDRRYD
jgi:hypothetical protein